MSSVTTIKPQDPRKGNGGFAAHSEQVSAPENGDVDHQNSMLFEEDIYQMSPHVKVTYNDIFAEPQGMHTFDKMNRVYGVMFNYTQAGVYNFLSLIIGWLLAIVWGIFFGILNFFFVWLVQPFTTLYFMTLKIWYDFYNATMRIWCDPFTRSMALMLSSIRGRFNLIIPGLESAIQRRKGTTFEA